MKRAFRLLVALTLCLALNTVAFAQTRESPVPIGVPADLGKGWRLTVLSVTPNANEMVARENRFNDPPRPGRQFFIARIAATYTGPGSARFDAGYGLRAVGATAVSYTTFQDSCGVIPDRFPEKEVFTGGTDTGNICWEVSSSDINSLVMYYHQFLSDAPRVFFSLVPGGPAAPPPPGAVIWVRGYPEIGPSGCVDYVAQWSDGTYSGTPWDCGPGTIARRGDLTATRGYPQLAANGCVEYVSQWSDGSYTWVPFECPPGVIYFKPY